MLDNEIICLHYHLYTYVPKINTFICFMSWDYLIKCNIFNHNKKSNGLCCFITQNCPSMFWHRENASNSFASKNNSNYLLFNYSNKKKFTSSNWAILKLATDFLESLKAKRRQLLFKPQKGVRQSWQISSTEKASPFR